MMVSLGERRFQRPFNLNGYDGNTAQNAKCAVSSRIKDRWFATFKYNMVG